MRNYPGLVEPRGMVFQIIIFQRMYCITKLRELKEWELNIKKGVKVGKDITLSQLADGNDAILIATGSKDTVKLDTPGIDFEGNLRWISIPRKTFSVNGIDNYRKNNN